MKISSVIPAYTRLSRTSIEEIPRDNNDFKNKSFKSLGTGPLGKFSIGFFEKMTGSLAANFLVLDFLGMVLPRVLQAYNRNSKEIGHKNFAAALEEFMREALTGPAIVLLPIAVALGFAKKVGKSVNTPKHLFEEYNDIVKTIIQDKKLNTRLRSRLKKLKLLNFVEGNREVYHNEVQKKVNKQFFDILFDRSIPEGFKNRDELLLKLKHELSYVASDDVKNAENIVSNHNKLYKTFEGRPYHINYPSTVSKNHKQPDGSVGDLVTTAKNYVDDVVSKIGPYMDHEKALTMLDNINAKIKAGRIVTSLGGILAVAVALRLIPYWYTRLHKVYPGLYGLGNIQYNEKENSNREMIRQANNGVIP